MQSLRDYTLKTAFDSHSMSWGLLLTNLLYVGDCF